VTPLYCIRMISCVANKSPQQLRATAAYRTGTKMISDPFPKLFSSPRFKTMLLTHRYHSNILTDARSFYTTQYSFIVCHYFTLCWNYQPIFTLRSPNCSSWCNSVCTSCLMVALVTQFGTLLRRMTNRDIHKPEYYR
jgi:hypothetical protein